MASETKAHYSSGTRNPLWEVLLIPERPGKLVTSATGGSGPAQVDSTYKGSEYLPTPHG